MGRRLAEAARGVVSAVLLLANTLFWAVPLYALIVARILLPRSGARSAVSRWLVAVCAAWARGNHFLLDRVHRIEWDVRVEGDLRPDRSYLVLANHQSWVDIPVVMRVLAGHVPFLRFFIKDQLKWVPILAQAWWALDMPFMKRYPRELVERRPELRGRDLEATRRACERLRGTPVAVLNFVEGTRFRPAKHRRQRSPYRHLLRPRAGGIAYALAVLGDQIDGIVDVTIAYPDGIPTFWDLLSGRVQRVAVRARRIELPPDLGRGDYENDPDYRERFQAWVRQLWEAKDRELEDLLREAGRTRRAA